ncbi:MAG: O-antigen ligase family protein, partial [Actinomycetota bacterium]
MRRPKHWILVAFVLLDVVLLDAALLLRSKSSTSLGAIGVFAFVWAFWTAMRWLNRRRKFTADQLAQLVYPGFLLTLIVLTWISFYSSSILSDFFKSDLDFNGRILLWRFSWDGFLDRPLAGWGWFAAWHTHNFFQEREFLTSLSSMTWSHSGIMDILLGGGIIGGAL